jgi:hypothetical protein
VLISVPLSTQKGSQMRQVIKATGKSLHPKQLWQYLSPEQQKTISQHFVRACQQLVCQTIPKERGNDR